MNFPLKVKDHFLTKEEFLLERDYSIPEIIRTKGLPKDLSSYYESPNYRSHNTKKKTLLDRLYFKLQEYNLSYKFKILQKESTGKKVLDYGCGSGSWISYLNSKKYKVTGFEPNKFAFENAILSNPDLPIFNNKEEVLNATYDVITLWHVLEHIENLDEVVEQLIQSLNKNGKLIIALPNYDSWDAKYFKNNWAAFDVPRHLVHFNRIGIRKYVKSFGIIMDNEYPLYLDAFYISLLSLNYKKKSILNYPFAFLLGLYSNMRANRDKNYSSVVYIASKP